MLLFFWEIPIQMTRFCGVSRGVPRLGRWGDISVQVFSPPRDTGEPARDESCTVPGTIEGSRFLFNVKAHFFSEAEFVLGSLPAHECQVGQAGQGLPSTGSEASDLLSAGCPVVGLINVPFVICAICRKCIWTDGQLPLFLRPFPIGGPCRASHPLDGGALSDGCPALATHHLVGDLLQALPCKRSGVWRTSNWFG